MDSVTLKKKLAAGEKVILLDVREPDEIKESPFFHSLPPLYLNIPLLILLSSPKEELEKRIFRSLGVPETTPIVALCHSGRRSEKACEHMKRCGWLVENLTGGHVAWGDPL